MWDGDGLLTALFNISLDAILKSCTLKGTITNGAVQIVAYVDDLAVLAKDRNGLKETTTLIEKEVNKRCLYINENNQIYEGKERKRSQRKGNINRELQIQNGG